MIIKIRFIYIVVEGSFYHVINNVLNRNVHLITLSLSHKNSMLAVKTQIVFFFENMFQAS
jgi:hypothetical protein